MAADSTIGPPAGLAGEDPLIAPDEAPRAVKMPPREWAKVNLFSSWFNTALTLVFGAVVIFALYRALRFVFVTADWTIVEKNLSLAMIGRFPRDDTWRVWTQLYLIMISIGLASGAATTNALERADEAGLEAEAPTLAGLARRFWPLILGVVVILQFTRTWPPTLLTLGALVAAILARQIGLALRKPARSWVPLAFTVGIVMSFRVVIGSAGSGFSLVEVVVIGVAIAVAAVLRERRAIVWIVVLVATLHVPIAEGGVGLDDWGGLQLSLLLAGSGIILAFPIGILLALGRRSSLAGLRTVSIGFIEFIRGVPLITLLLAANFFLGFFLPLGSETPSLVGRAIVVITLFSGAYIAEIIRGGLQAVPKGQAEAAQALGLSPVQVSRLVVMPQALRAVMPAMVGQFISLYKDTSLVVIIGLTDLLRFSELANAQPEFVGRELGAITLTFVGLIYWVGSYTMSRESRRLEKKLGVGER